MPQFLYLSRKQVRKLLRRYHDPITVRQQLRSRLAKISGAHIYTNITPIVIDAFIEKYKHDNNTDCVPAGLLIALHHTLEQMQFERDRRILEFLWWSQSRKLMVGVYSSSRNQRVRAREDMLRADRSMLRKAGVLDGRVRKWDDRDWAESEIERWNEEESGVESDSDDEEVEEESGVEESEEESEVEGGMPVRARLWLKRLPDRGEMDTEDDDPTEQTGADDIEMEETGDDVAPEGTEDGINQDDVKQEEMEEEVTMEETEGDVETESEGSVTMEETEEDVEIEEGQGRSEEAARQRMRRWLATVASLNV